MRKVFIYISLIALTATFTLGETFAKVALQNITEEVDFSNEKEPELEESYTEAVFDTKGVEINGSEVLNTHSIFCEKETVALTSGVLVATNTLYLLNCQILR